MGNEEPTLESDTSTQVVNGFSFSSSNKTDIKTRFEELSATIEYQRNTNNNLMKWLDEERDKNKELKFEIIQEREKRDKLNIAYRQRSDNLIKENTIAMNKVETEIKDLKNKILDLQELIQPRPLTEEDKKRILADFFVNEE